MYDFCGQPAKELIQSYKFTYKTSNQNTELSFTNNLIENPDNKSLGIRKFEVYAHECMPKCAGCTNSTSCNLNSVGQYLEACRCIEKCELCKQIDSCDLCNSGYFYNDSKCVSACPNKKYKNIKTRTCHNCLAKYATYSNANGCDTCFWNRQLPNCDCPIYQYDNQNYQQACFACSNISDGCSTCNDRTCQECLAPRFLDGNSCVNICPSGKWGNTATRQCTACQAKCVTCSNDNTCDTCFENRVPQQCNCPQYSYDPHNQSINYVL
ncbi:zinc finger lsd1 subclass family protein, putative [Ichthyophthirius multifiliis]|uniref:Zinc finger lsd1 subclass family protein, putative n=1 Tax=Ichthyophthirius multifiliis TaxID=5932 RepID=G0QVG3_ICHMU|nr:zinc finger lsd1 subclass family protein, putative [Ichthyophthirius multifiliis]EGR30791.1 zinc finger lsd1 subclass family protein, putative [Ichthyophthirius multifiliis]|eukprot:XP_004032378.1 zinc finger lsd1 subclass family protein, putative [Ichthyophthirius multifiliis]